MADSPVQDAPAAGRPARATNRKRNALAFACIVVVWLALDLATKSYFNSGAFSLGEDIAGPFLGLFQFTLVHNTGAAWGAFGDATFLLAELSILICAAIVVHLFVFSPQSGTGQAVGLAFVFAGGVGNVIDRLVLGYVVDFIELSFMDFPVFNVADIGVTCGFVIFVAALFLAMRNEVAEGRRKQAELMEAKRRQLAAEKAAEFEKEIGSEAEEPRE